MQGYYRVAHPFFDQIVNKSVRGGFMLYQQYSDHQRAYQILTTPYRESDSYLKRNLSAAADMQQMFRKRFSDRLHQTEAVAQKISNPLRQYLSNI